MTESIRLLTQEIAQQNQDVPYFRDSDSPEFTAQMILDEALELVKELETAFVTDDLSKVVGEIADVLYLALKLCNFLGVNPDEAIRLKVLRNQMKYGDHYTRESAVEAWGEKGDELFYLMYMML